MEQSSSSDYSEQQRHERKEPLDVIKDEHLPTENEKHIVKSDTSEQGQAAQSTELKNFDKRDVAAHPPCFNDLPDEIIVKILSYLSFDDLVDNVQNVCVRWKNLAHDPELWQDKVYIVRNRSRSGRSCCGVVCTECSHCKCNKRDDEALRTLPQTPQLRTMILQRGTIGSVLRTMYRRCPNLTTLQLHVCQKISHTLLLEIFIHCPKIHTLIIPSKWLISWRYLEILAVLKNLHTLVVLECVLLPKKVELRMLADKCKNLRNIDLDSAYYPLEDLKYFLRVKSYCLTSLTIRWTMEGKRCVVPLLADTCANSLEKLQLHLYDVLPEEETSVFNALGQLHNLRWFTARNVGLRQPPLFALAFQPGCLSMMQRVDLRYTESLANELIVALSVGCPLLRELRLHHSPRITDDGLTKIHFLKHLKILEMTSCDGLGGSSISQIAQLPSLHTLVLQQLTDLGKLLPGLVQILEMKKLRSLDLLHSGNIMCVPFDKFPGKLTNLRHLHVYYDEEPNFLEDLTSRMPKLKIHESTNYSDSDWEPDYTLETEEDTEDENLYLDFL